MSFMKTMYASTRNAGRIWTPACMWPAARHPIGEVACFRVGDGELLVLLLKLTIVAIFAQV